MLVPKTSVDEQDNSVLSKNHIWSTGQPPYIQPISEALPPNCPPHVHLRLSVPSANPRHDAGTEDWVHCVSHALKPFKAPGMSPFSIPVQKSP